MTSFREFHTDELDAAIARREMQEFGYLFLRGVIPQTVVDSLVREVLAVVDEAGWLAPGSNPLNRLPLAAAATHDRDEGYRDVLDRIFRLEAFHALAHHSALERAMQLLTGPDLLIHPQPVPRAIFPAAPNFLTPTHQDHTAIGGTIETFTCWMPLHDCPVENGSLRVLERSHRYGLQPTLPGTGHIDPGQLRGGDWAQADFRAGDVLFFHSLAVHAPAYNNSGRMRLSLDCRFQDATLPIDPANLIFTRRNAHTWDEVYKGWRSTELQYYWKSLPLTLKPSLEELRSLAATAEDQKMRERYTRILERTQNQTATAAQYIAELL